MEFVKSSDGAHNPSDIYGVAERRQFFDKWSVAQCRLLDTGSQLQQIAQQPIEHGDLFFEGRFAIFREGRGFRKKLCEAFAVSSALQNAQSVSALLRCLLKIHFDG